MSHIAIELSHKMGKRKHFYIFEGTIVGISIREKQNARIRVEIHESLYKKCTSKISLISLFQETFEYGKGIPAFLWGYQLYKPELFRHLFRERGPQKSSVIQDETPKTVLRISEGEDSASCKVFMLGVGANALAEWIKNHFQEGRNIPEKNIRNEFGLPQLY